MNDGKRALVVIDMLNDFLDPEGTLSLGEAGRAIIPRVSELVEEARARGHLIVFVRDRHLPEDPEFAMFPPHCVSGSEGAEIITELQPAGGEAVMDKRRYSAFYATELDLLLRENKIWDIELCGVCTNICVLYTAASARNRAYRVYVHRDAVAGTAPGAHEWALSEMENTLGCEII